MSEVEAPTTRVVDGTARAEKAWVDDHARDRESVFHQHRRELIGQLRADRARKTLLERYRHASEEIARMSTVGAKPVERSSHNADRAAGPPSQALAETREAERFIRAGVEMLEAIVDELKGLGAMRQIDQMMAHEKDAMILNELVGWTPAEIEVFYRGKLGSAETIRRLRRREKLSGRTGLPVEPRPVEQAE